MSRNWVVRLPTKHRVTMLTISQQKKSDASSVLSTNMVDLSWTNPTPKQH
jgi:hypothetical protein